MQILTVPVETIRALKLPGQAIELARRTAGLEKKEIYLALGIDPGTWSKIEESTASLADKQKADFAKLVGNNIYLEWVCFQHGCTAVLIKSEAERQVDELKARLAERDTELRVLMKAFKGGTP